MSSLTNPLEKLKVDLKATQTPAHHNTASYESFPLSESDTDDEDPTISDEFSEEVHTCADGTIVPLCERECGIIESNKQFCFVLANTHIPGNGRIIDTVNF